MKKLFIIFMCLVCALPLAACSSKDDKAKSDYIADNVHCVVSLPQEYDVFYDNEEIASSSMFDKDLYNAETVNGSPKKVGFRYYNLLKGEPFRILTPLGIISDKNENGQTLVYWKLNDTLYKDGDNYYSENAFALTKDTEITPVYCNFRPVGMLLHEVDENGMPVVQDVELFDGEGNVKEQRGVHYLYGVYDFEPYHEFWRTDLTLNKYVINHTVKYVAENYGKDFYTVNIEIERGDLFENGKIIVEKLYKIEGHGYMTYGAKNIINGDDLGKAVRTLALGKHELKYTFT